jgi:uncharacterized protein (TIGR00730 family)
MEEFIWLMCLCGHKKERAMSFFQKLFQTIKIFFKQVQAAWQLAHGVWKIYSLNGSVVSIFGGHLSVDPDAEAKAYHIAQALVKNNISVITGGGPGIMKAANCGAYEADKQSVKTMGIMVKNFAEGINVCAKKSVITVNYLATRKWLLIDYSIGFVIFPGGIGTMNEFSDLLTLMWARHQSRVPIVLMGTTFWEPFLQWFYEAQRLNLIDKEVSSYFVVTDDPNVAVKYLIESCVANKACKL